MGLPMGIYVDRIYQREGGGTGLVNAFLERCDTTRPVEVGVIDDNLDAQEFYRNMGFEIVSNSLHKFNEYMHEIVMVRPAA